MAKIPLRSYIRKIENMLESGKITEAIAHCHHILSMYPRYIEIYRLLGKAFLDNKENEEAQLVFDQMLKVFPDDFISHLGLSFLYEEKQDYPLAVEHMERAFEIQPSNPSLQDELKRLYKIRDGIEPTKVRLTRGALIKMYARSKLFQQAIAEINIALHEHPNRLDLLIKLADMQFALGLRIEAIETCINIVSKYPYCFNANKILTQALLESSEAEDVKIYFQRLVDIDPYILFTSKDNPDVFSIPDIAITINDLENINIENPNDWKTFILDSWTSTPKLDLSKSEETAINWDEIIENNFENTENNTNLSSEPLKDLQTTEESKDSSPSIDEIRNSAGDEQPEENMDQNSSQSEKVDNHHDDENQNIPEWLIEEDQKEILNENNKNDDSIVPSLNSNLDENETGFIDHDAPIIEPLNSNHNETPFTWIQEEDMGEEKESQQETPAATLNDTAENSPQYFDVVLKDAHDALLSGYSQRAVDSYHLLVNKYIKNEKVRSQLESDIENFPQIGELWLILGDIYKNSGNIEKALELYQIAENKISAGANEQT